MRSRLIALLLACVALMRFAGAVQADPVHAVCWQAVEIPFTSQASYARPFYDVDVDVAFRGPSGQTLVRPAFWDGGATWKVRFAAPVVGTWTYVTSASDKSNAGLNGQAGTVTVEPYRGNLAIYKHGFVTVSPNHRYFVYADGTPFFYLGDTHWFAMRERFADSNLPGCASQFKLYVDTRVAQGFTVYQTEWGMGGWPAGDLNAGYHWQSGIDESDIPGFHNVDRKFAYLAEKGMVCASAIAWRTSIQTYDDDYLRRLGRNWSARYGAYPVLWTVAQEVDPADPHDPPGLVDKWQTMAEALAASDAYHHPLTAHMHDEFRASAAMSPWRDKPYHVWFAVQNISNNGVQHKDGPLWDATAEEYWNSKPTKPAILYEQQYENYGTDAGNARINAYAPYLCGFYGHGFGEAAIWNDRYTQDDAIQSPTLDGTGAIWYEALQRPINTQMSYLASFYRSLDWWTLIPRFDVANWLTTNDPADVRVAGSDTTTVALLWGDAGGVLHQLRKSALYSASWFDPRAGTWIPLPDAQTDASGSWAIPSRPSSQDYLLVLKVKANDR